MECMGSCSGLSYCTCAMNIQLNHWKFGGYAGSLDSCRNHPIGRMKLLMARVISTRLSLLEWMEKDFFAFGGCRSCEAWRRKWH